jgi:hypothetical protein
MMNNAVRAAILLAIGVVLRDCALLAAGVLLLAARMEDRLDACPDRAHAWLRCLLGGALLVVAGSLLAVHAGSVFLGWWPVGQRAAPMLALVLAPVVALGGLAWREVSPQHLAAALGAPAALLVALQWAPWAPCAFAALAAVYVIADGARHLGPVARGLAASHHEQ